MACLLTSVVLGSCVAVIAECDVVSSVHVYASTTPGRWRIEADDGSTSVRCEFVDPGGAMFERCISTDQLLWVLMPRQSGRSTFEVTSLSLPATIHVRVARDDVVVADRTVAMHHERSAVDYCPSSIEAIDID